eukprot:gene22547-biopygen10263
MAQSSAICPSWRGHIAHRFLGGAPMCPPKSAGETAADADRTRTGRGPHDRIQRNGRGPDADRTRAWPFLPGLKFPAPNAQTSKKQLFSHTCGQLPMDLAYGHYHS